MIASATHGGLVGMFLADNKIPNREAIALSPTVGWLTLACVAVFLAIIVTRHEAWRRYWLRSEDPRALGMFRILFALFTISNINGIWEHFIFLFTDEGIFLTETARQVFASKQFAGFGDGFGGDPPGFFDSGAVLTFLQGPKYSLLYFWDSPAFFWVHLWAFEIVMVLFMLGWRSRTTGVIGFVLMNSIMHRNALYWTGADLVYRCFFFYLILAKTGHAYSIDNWLRCRRLRRAGRLSELGTIGGGAGAPVSDEHPHGLEAIYRRIPGWPRTLMMMQLATVYFFTGCAKTGSVWWRGDSLYYALNLDHFTRIPTGFMTQLFGTNLFRLMTWVVHFWQIGFPLMVIGLVIRWSLRNGTPPATGVTRWVHRGLWAALIVLVGTIAYVVWPVHHTPFSRGWFVFAWAALWSVLWAMWWKLGHAPPRVSSIFGLRQLDRTYVLDRDWFLSWFLGRRLWLLLGLLFHLHIFVLMNIGMFAPIMMMVYVCCLEGMEIATILHLTTRGAHRLGLRWIPIRSRVIPTENAALPHLRHDGAQVPRWGLGLAAGLATLALALRGLDVPGARTSAIAAVVVLAVAAVRSWRGARSAPPSPVAWAYGPLGRTLAAAFIFGHVSAVAIWCMPAKDSTSAFRGPARKVVRTYLGVTQTTQSWNMFSPNPIRTNAFLKIVVTDESGEAWDLRVDANSPRHKATPWIWYSRAGKIARRIVGDGKWYQKWMARYHCREWARTHGGQPPEKVDLIKLWYRIPPPEKLRKLGYYVPAQMLEKSGHEEYIHTERCERGIDSQLTNEMRERYDLPAIPDDSIRRWTKHRKRKWDARARNKGS